MPDNNATISAAIEDAVTSPALGELGKDALEVTIDALMTDGVGKEIPIISAIFQTIDVIGRVRESFLKRKILTFLIDMNRVSASDRKAAVAKLFASDKERRKFYDLILHVVDELRTEERV